MLKYVLLLIGFIMLIKGADIFVEHASRIAKRLGIPSIIVGMTIVAIGTSAPEFSVSLQSSLAGMNDMSVANVVGSNIFNLLVVLGASSFMNTLKISKYKDVLMTLAVCILLMSLALGGTLCTMEGIVLLLAFSIYIILMIKGRDRASEASDDISNKKPNIILLLLGLGAIIYGGNIVVDNASLIAMSLGMSETLVGLTIVAIGTSLPEFVTSVIATKKGEVDIAIGNVLGSNIFNVLLVLGTTAVINPISVSLMSLIDIVAMILSVIIFIILTHKQQQVHRNNGIIMIILYVIYIVFTIIR